MAEALNRITGTYSSMDSMDAYSNDYEEVLRKALERIKQLKEENQALSAELTTVTGQLGSGQSYQGKMEELERENQQLAAELDTTRKKLQALKDVVTKSFADLKQEAQHLNKKLDAAYTVLDLYELLYEASPPQTRTERGDPVIVSAEGLSSGVPVEAPVHAGEPLGKQIKHPELGGAETREPTLRRLPLETDDAEGSDKRGHGVVTFFPGAREWAEHRAPMQLEGEVEQHTYDRSGLPLSSAPPPPPTPCEAPPADASLSPAMSSRPEASYEPLSEEIAEHSSDDEDIQVIVSPFSSFGAINRFTSAIRALPGVSRATIRRFQKGKLQVSVEYAGVVPLSHRLLDLREFSVSVIDTSPGRVEAVLESFGERGSGASSLGA